METRIADGESPTRPRGRDHDRDRTRAVALRNCPEASRIAGYRLPRADVTQILQVARRNHQRHQPVDLGEARPGFAPRVRPVPQQVDAGHPQYGQHQAEPGPRDGEFHAPQVQEAADGGTVELERQPRQIAHARRLLVVHFETLDEGSYVGRIRLGHGLGRSHRHDPCDQAAEGRRMAVRQRNIARFGSIFRRGIDRDIADQKNRCVAGSRRPGHGHHSAQRHEPGNDCRCRRARITPALRTARH